MTDGILSHRFSCFILALAICSISIRLVSGAAIRTADRDVPTFCTVDPRWAVHGVSKDDCLATVDKLYDIEVKSRSKKWEKDDFEFLSPRMPGTAGLEQRYTPRKYTVGELTLAGHPFEERRTLELTEEGTCTLAIVMLRFFQDKDVDLPLKEEGYCAYRDVASFYELWEAGDRIRKDCLQGTNMPGMATEGGRGAIGVFMWATDSWQNKLVPSGESMPPWYPRGVLTLNGTASGHAFSNVTIA